MKPIKLLPHQFKKIGWYICLPSALVGLWLQASNFETLSWKTHFFALASDEIFGEKKFFGSVEVNLLPTLVGALFIIGAMLVAVSKEKIEDEYISSLRLSALLWALCVNSLLLLLALFFIWGGYFLTVMVYNMFTILILFILRFNYQLYRSKKEG